MRLKNKVALITGAARGIGAETAKLFAAEGATVIVTDILDEEGQSLVKSIGQHAVYFHLDVADEKDWEALIEPIQTRYGKIDILFNNAGIIGFDDKLGPQDPEYVSLSSWRYIHAINLDGVLLGCQFAMRLMKNHGGSIINMSSRSGLVGIPTAAAYASSKAAIRNHTKSVALYCAEKKYNIRCNSVHPGAILTPLWDSMLGDNAETRQAAINAIATGIPLGHMGEPLDVAYAVLFLASDESKYITGAEFTLDGGILAGSTAAPK
jgi:3(or 17)beta-hydroxysteroid dehydrogenase